MQLLLTTPFDALLLDNWMPKINGIELCRMIRSHDQKLPIFCSGAVTEGDKKVALEPVRRLFWKALWPGRTHQYLYAPPWTSNQPRPTFSVSVFTSLIPRSHPFTFRAPIVSDHAIRVFYPELASALMFTSGHFVLLIVRIIAPTICSND